MNPTLAALFVYLLVQFAIGVWVSRRIRTEADYLVAGRKLGVALGTFSIFATWFGAETVVGSAGYTYAEGFSFSSAEPFGYGLCLILMGLLFAVPLWKRELTTLADLFRQRYGIGVERAAAIILIPGSILWAAAQVRAFGQVLASVATGLEVELAIGIAAGITILYTVLGGLLADAITDLIQGALLTVGLVVLMAAVTFHLGGVEATVDVLLQPGRLPDVAPTELPFWATLEEWAIPICGSLVATELVGRIIATRSAGVARSSSLLAGTLYIGVGVIPVLIGLVGVSVVPDLADSEQIIPAVAQALLPTWLFAVFAGSLISAIISTVDSTLLIASGLLSHNLIVPLLGHVGSDGTVREVTEQRKVLLARGGVVVFGILAYFLALNSSGVLALVEEASAFGSAGALVTVSFALFTPWGGPRTAMATLLVGVVSYLAASFGGFAYPFLLSLALSLGTYVLGSMGGLTGYGPLDIRVGLRET